MNPIEPLEVTAFLSSYPADIREAALALRRTIYSVAPGSVETVHLPAKMISYSFARTYKDMLCVIMPYNGWVNLGFPMGSGLQYPQQILTGTGKRARHVKITGILQASTPAVNDLVREALKALTSRD